MKIIGEHGKIQHDIVLKKAGVYISDISRSLYAYVMEDYAPDDDDNTDLVISFHEDVCPNNIIIYLDGCGRLMIKLTDVNGHEQVHTLI